MSKIIEMNGTKVEVKVESGKTIIQIITEDADVSINGEYIYQKYDLPEYNHIPVVLRPFVHDHQEFIQDDGEQITGDLWLEENNTCASFYIPKNSRKPIVVRFGYVSSLKDIEEEFIRNRRDIDEETANQLMEELYGLEQTLLKEIEAAGYKFAPSHGSGRGFHCWWDVIFPLKKWNEEQFVTVWNAIDTFNKRYNSICYQYNYL